MERLPDGGGDDEMNAERNCARQGAEHAKSASDFDHGPHSDKASIDAAFLVLSKWEHGDLFGALPDLSVDANAARILKRKRWYGVVEVSLPRQLDTVAGEFLEDFVDEHLKGREAIPTVEGKTICVSFAMNDATEQDLQNVHEFAEALAAFVESGPDAIVQRRIMYVDTSEYDHLGPYERWPFTG